MDVSAVEQLPAWLQVLLSRPQAFPHAVRTLELVQTHISWVVLTGEYAYKFKKPVKLSFLDFSTLALRRAACAAELRLNRRLAPQLYLEVVPLAGSERAPQLGGAGAAFEYAVKMRQFPQEAQLDRRLAAGAIGAAECERLAARIAQLHESAPIAAPDSVYGAPERVQRDVAGTLRDLLDGADDAWRAPLQQLESWTYAQGMQLAPLMLARRREGRVREVHGDLHLANLVLIDGEVLPFDCIEFDPQLRWIDLMNDLAFLLMDLRAHGRSDLAYRVLDRYLQATGDYQGLPLLSYFMVYRALVRAKVAQIRVRAGDGAAQAQVHTYVQLAVGLAQAPRPALLLMHGLSGSGKTWLSEQLLATLPAVRVRSDVERKRLHGLAADQRSGAQLNTGLYSAGGSARTYARLAELARSAIEGGERVIVDAAFLQRRDREAFRDLAAQMHVPLAIVSCAASEPQLRERIAARMQAGADASEADLPVLEQQLRNAEPLAPAERGYSIVVETAAPAALDAALSGLKGLLGR